METTYEVLEFSDITAPKNLVSSHAGRMLETFDAPAENIGPPGATSIVEDF